MNQSRSSTRIALEPLARGPKGPGSQVQLSGSKATTPSPTSDSSLWTTARSPSPVHADWSTDQSIARIVRSFAGSSGSGTSGIGSQQSAAGS